MTNNLTDGDSLTLTRVLPALRREARLSQVQLAELAGVARSAVSGIERGATRPKADTLRLLADGLATDGTGVHHPDQAAAFYLRLMRAAGYIEAAPPSEPLRPRPVEDLTEEEVAEALTRLSQDRSLSAQFLAVAGNWQQMSVPAQRAVLNGFELARQFDEEIQAAEARDAARRRRQGS